MLPPFVWLRHFNCHICWFLVPGLVQGFPTAVEDIAYICCYIVGSIKTKIEEKKKERRKKKGQKKEIHKALLSVPVRPSIN
ncbi:hypothetical protein DER45DRAFT_172246 [Fusarium avenaceum]|nr:hypothetical protein DER45DRAFT_172246 [Fusarium avenaceum]